MAYKIRVILDVEEDVFRDILVDENNTLEQLHFIIAKSFGFDGKELASFYETDERWEQGEEIPLVAMDEDYRSMQNCLLKDELIDKGDKLLYVYDFFAMWTFFIELKNNHEETILELPSIALSFGNTPKNAPNKEFKSDENFDDFDEFKDDFDESDTYEDFDDYNY